MKVYDAPNIRNVALVGHGGCGKTSLASALLFDDKVEPATAAFERGVKLSREMGDDAQTSRSAIG